MRGDRKKERERKILTTMLGRQQRYAREGDTCWKRESCKISISVFFYDANVIARNVRMRFAWHNVLVQ